MKNPSLPTGSFNVGVIGFEPTTPCSQSVVLTVYFSTRDSIFNAFVSTECVSTLPFLASFAYVGKSSCNSSQNRLETINSNNKEIGLICLTFHLRTGELK